MTGHSIHALNSELLCSFALFVGAVCFTFGMEEALRHSTGPCGGGSVRRVPDVICNPLRGGTGREDPEGWERATKETGMVDGHCHLDRRAVSVGKDARSIL